MAIVRKPPTSVNLVGPASGLGDRGPDGHLSDPLGKLLPMPGQRSPVVLLESLDPDTFVSDFNLVAELAGGTARRYATPSDREPTWLSLHSFPTFIGWNIERVLAGSKCSAEIGTVACLAFGLARLQQHPIYKTWETYREQAVSVKYEDDDDYHLVMSLLKIDITDNDAASGFRRRNIRCPEWIRQANSNASNLLGMAASTVARVAIMDGLRIQSGIVPSHLKVMDMVVDELYKKVEKQTRRVKLISGALRRQENSRDEDGDEDQDDPLYDE